MRPLLTCAAAVCLTALPAVASAEGNLASGATDLTIEISGNLPALSENMFEIETGKYYRLNLVSDGAEEFMFASPDLLANIHVRLVVIEGIEVHLQGMTFRGIEFDEGGTASFSFVPIRPGDYEFTIGEATGTIVVH